MTTAPDAGAAAVSARGPVPDRAGPPEAVEVIGVAVHEVQGVRGRGDLIKVRPVDVHVLPGEPRRAGALHLVPALAPESEPTAAPGLAPGTAGEADEVEARADAASEAGWPLKTPTLRGLLALAPAADGDLAEPGDQVSVVPLEDEPAPVATAAPADPVVDVIAVPAAIETPDVVDTTAAAIRPVARPDRPGVRARRRSRSGRPALPWLRRRWWVATLLLIAGVAGGYTMTKGHRGTYSSQVLLEVRSGSTPANPGGAQEASALAVTYAALVPSDTAVTSAVATRLGVPPATVGAGLSATAESGTGLFVVTYTAPTAAQAIAGANEAGAVLASAAPPGLAIIERSVAVVKEASTAKHSKDKRLYGEVGGAVGGLLLGLIFVLVLERVDARVDDPEDAAEACGCPATRWPGGMSVRELTFALARQVPEGALTLVPISRAADKPAEQLGTLLAEAWPGGAEKAEVSIVTPFEESPAALSEGSGPTVLAVTPGERVRSLSEVRARLGLLGRAPLFVVLVARS